MRYSPYVTYGHQGLTLAQHPAHALSGYFKIEIVSYQNRPLAKEIAHRVIDFNIDVGIYNVR